MQLYTMDGQMLIKKKSNSHQLIDFNKYKPGNYLLKIQNKQRISTNIIIKM